MSESGNVNPRPDDLVTVTMRRDQWEVVVAAAADYDRRVPRSQGDGGACLDAIDDALGYAPGERRVQ